jgi:putative addiction module antidote
MGNSLGVWLPAEILKKLGLEDGDTVYVNEVDRKIILTEMSQKEDEEDFKMKVISIIEEYMKEKG